MLSKGILIYEQKNKTYDHREFRFFIDSEKFKEKRGVVINEIMRNKENKIIAISPMSYPVNFLHHLSRKDILAIELIDTAENLL